MALLVTLLSMMIVSVLAVCVLDTTTTETLIMANHAASQQALFTADAGLERSLADLLDAAHWNDVLSGAVKSTFVVPGPGALPDGRSADVTVLTREVQAASDGFYGAGADRPVWQPYASGPLATLLPGIPLADYVLVWVADDPGETDGDPMRDSNGVVLLRADGHGQSSARRGIEAAVRRRLVTIADGPAGNQANATASTETTRILWWREVR